MGIEDDMHKIIGVCDATFNLPEVPEVDVESTLNSIVSVLMVMQTTEKTESLIVAFCEKLSKAPNCRNLGGMALRVLFVLFQSLTDKICMKYHIYLAMVQVSGQIGEIRMVYGKMESLTHAMKEAQQPPSTEQVQSLLRLLHTTLCANDMSAEASTVMLELLGTFTTENASQARDDAHRCIVTSIADPNTFIMDDLLDIFVHEKLKDYTVFYNNHKEFVSGLGLDHSALVRKMRILTFIQLAQDCPEMSFTQLMQELDLPRDEIEPFVVEALMTKLVVARIDQMSERVCVATAEFRTFSRKQWQGISDAFVMMQEGLTLVKEQTNAISNAPTIS